MRYYNKIMSNSSRITTSTWRLEAILNFVKKGFSAQGKLWDFLQVIKEDNYSEHFLKFSALYFFFPFENLKFLDYLLKYMFYNLTCIVFCNPK